MTAPGAFKAEHWDDGDYVITCAIGPIGQTLSAHNAKQMAEWLNTAIPELLRKLESGTEPEAEEAP